MVDLSSFDSDAVEATKSDFEPLPAGQYLVAMIDSDMKKTKAGTGEYLELTWEVLDGEFTGRRLWDRLNLVNSNETAVKIANGTLKQICEATGIKRPKDSGEFYGKPLMAKVKIVQRKDTGEMKNEIGGYLSTTVTGFVAAPKTTTHKAPAAKAAPPWKQAQ